MNNRKPFLVLSLLAFTIFLWPNFASAKYKMVSPGFYSTPYQMVASGTDFYVAGGDGQNYTVLEKHGSGAWTLATSSSIYFRKPFISGDTAFITANDNGFSQDYVYHKDSPGSPWVLTPINFSSGMLAGLTFRNGIGFAASYGGDILISTSSMDSWSVVTSTGDTFDVWDFHKIFDPYFGDENHQIALGENHFYSLNGAGNNWEAFNIPTLSANDYISDFVFDGFTSGWVTVNNHNSTDGRIFYTADGVSWTQVYSSSTLEFKSIQRINNQVVALANKYGGSTVNLVSIQATSTSAISSSSTWNLIGEYKPFDNSSLNGASLYPDGSGYFWRSNTLIGKTVDSGAAWSFPFNQQSFSVEDLSFLDNNTGYSVSGYNSGNTVLSGEVHRTVDGGNTWSKIYSTSTADINSVYATGTDIWIGGLRDIGGGTGGFIGYSHDSGQSWSQMAAGYYSNIDGLRFFSTSTGIYITHSGIKKTINGGQSWATVYGAGIKGISFPSDSTGYAVKLAGGMLKTTNNGDTWTSLNNTNAFSLLSTYFTDDNTGFAVGTVGTIIKTIDGGATWSATTSPICPNCTFNSVKFSSPINGRIIGEDTNNKTWILSTFDGGYSWQGEIMGSSNISGYYQPNSAFLSMAAKPNGDFFLGGYNGLLVHYDTTVGITNPTIDIPEGNTITFDVGRDNTSGNLAVNYQISGLDASNTNDPLTSYVSIANGNSAGSAYISTLDNHIVEANKPFTVSLLPGEYMIDPLTYFNNSNLLNINTANLVVSPLSSQVTEGGATSTISVSLHSMPSGAGQVTVSLTPTSTMGYLLSTSSMLFDNTNWNIPQTTTVSAIDDQVVNGTRYATITIAVATST
ncbi:MAG: YCF48-related protein, partial [Candidatus Falkowbacteria bacterium]|nr:YCF48-related protein [Candidatus Falkowbacteria bacterium]